MAQPGRQDTVMRPLQLYAGIVKQRKGANCVTHLQLITLEALRLGLLYTLQDCTATKLYHTWCTC